MAPSEAGRLEGADPDYAQRDLYNSIESGKFPSWSMFIQVMTFDEAENWKFNPFDLTKVCCDLLKMLKMIFINVIVTSQ